MGESKITTLCKIVNDKKCSIAAIVIDCDRFLKNGKKMTQNTSTRLFFFYIYLCEKVIYTGTVIFSHCFQLISSLDYFSFCLF